jgi:hypothetical protein
MSFLAWLQSAISWNTLGGRKFVLIYSTMAFLGWCAVHAIKIDQAILDMGWKLIGIYCGANVGKVGIDWLIEKVKGTAATTPTDNAALVAALQEALDKAKALPVK